MRILVLGAFQRELDSIIEGFPDNNETMIAKRHCRISKRDGHEIFISLSGIGTTAAASTTTAFCEALEPDLIIMCGVSGGLSPDMQVGDLVLASKVIDADLYALHSLLKDTPYEACLTDPHTLQPTKNEYIVHPLILDKALIDSIGRLRAGIVATSNTFPAPKSLFTEIKKLGCSAIEMESVGVFKAAEYYKIPVMTIRAISNLLDESGADLGTEPNALEICSKRLALFLTNFLLHLSELQVFAQERQEKRVAELIVKYELHKHPEGGWFRRTFESDDLVKAEGSSLKRYAGEARAAGTSIIYLLTEGDYSAWHTVQSDETWSFHAGDPLLLRVINPCNGELKEVLLSAKTGLLQYTVKAGYIFSAESLGRFSLTGCMVTPGFDFKDFNLISQQEFSTKYPKYDGLARLIRDQPVKSDALEVRRFFNDARLMDAKKSESTFNFTL